METIIAILNKVLWFVFFLSVLNVGRHTYRLIQTFFISTNTEEENVRYILETRDLIILGMSMAFILMSIFSGIVL